jgi:hypothetical protein
VAIHLRYLDRKRSLPPQPTQALTGTSQQDGGTSQQDGGSSSADGNVVKGDGSLSPPESDDDGCCRVSHARNSDLPYLLWKECLEGDDIVLAP